MLSVFLNVRILVRLARYLLMLNKLHVSKTDASQLSLYTHLSQHLWLLLLNSNGMSRSNYERFKCD